MMIKSKYPNLENSDVLSKDIVALFKKNRLLSNIPMFHFLSGFLVIVLFIVCMAAGKIMVFLLPAGVIIMVTALISELVTSRRIESVEKVYDIVMFVKRNAVVYFSDNVFSGLLKKQRLIIVKKLTQSGNLKNYELAGDYAVASKSLHLSPERVKTLINPDLFGLVTSVPYEKLKIIESKTLIMPADMADALKSQEFYQDKKLLYFHNDKLLTCDLGKSCELDDKFEKAKAVCFITGFVIALIGILALVISEIVSEVNLYFVIIFAIGFLCAFSAVFVNGVQSKKFGNLSKISKLADELNSEPITGINDSCFDGLSLASRLVVVNKLITSGKLRNKELIDNIAIADIGKFTPEQAEDKLREFAEVEAMRFRQTVKIILPRTAVNCESCGAALKENNNFCTYCGSKLKLKEAVEILNRLPEVGVSHTKTRKSKRKK